MANMLRAREIPVALAAGSVILVLIDAFFTVPKDYNNVIAEFQNWATPMTAMALAIAFFVILQWHGRQVMKRTPRQWWLSLWTIIIMVIVFVLGLIPPTARYYWFTTIYGWVYIPADAALAGIQACYIASATYRAFRAKTIDGAFCLISAFFVLFGINTALGDIISPIIPAIADWFVVVPNLGGNRTLLVITAAGMLGLTFRLAVGREREIA